MEERTKGAEDLRCLDFIIQSKKARNPFWQSLGTAWQGNKTSHGLADQMCMGWGAGAEAEEARAWDQTLCQKAARTGSNHSPRPQLRPLGTPGSFLGGCTDEGILVSQVPDTTWSNCAFSKKNNPSLGSDHAFLNSTTWTWY